MGSILDRGSNRDIYSVSFSDWDDFPSIVMEKSRNGGAPSRGDTRQASRNFFDADHDDDFSSYFKKKSTNPFDDEDESDGPLEAFQHRKSCSEDEPRGFGSRSNYPNSPFDLKNSPEEKPFPSQQTHLQKIQAINDRTLATTTRSLQLIDESEAVGTAAAQVNSSQITPSYCRSLG